MSLWKLVRACMKEWWMSIRSVLQREMFTVSSCRVIKCMFSCRLHIGWPPHPLPYRGHLYAPSCLGLQDWRARSWCQSCRSGSLWHCTPRMGEWKTWGGRTQLNLVPVRSPQLLRQCSVGGWREERVVCVCVCVCVCTYACVSITHCIHSWSHLYASIQFSL